MKNDDTVFSLSNTCYVVYINTFSETVAPSMRVGYMVLPKPMVKDFEEKLGLYKKDKKLDNILKEYSDNVECQALIKKIQEME